VRTSQQTTVFTAAQDYYTAVLNREVLGVVKSTYELAKRHYEDVQAREKAGTASKFDVLRAKVAMQNQEAQVISADNNARLSVAALLREVGLPQDSRLDLVTGFGKAGATPSVEEALRAAAVNRSELASAALNTQAQRHAVAASRAGYMPKVSGVASWGGTSVEDPTKDDNFTESGSLGVVVQWNIFDGALTKARVAEAKADLLRLQWQEKGLRKDIELQVRQAVLNLESARTFIESQGANVDEATEALRLADARQRAGAGTELDVQDARNALEQAKLNYVQSLSQYATARLSLDQATGVLETTRR
jgi:outer membrane protein